MLGQTQLTMYFIIRRRGVLGYFERGLFCTVEIWMCFSTQISIIFVYNAYFHEIYKLKKVW